MTPVVAQTLLPLLQRIDPERAHHLGLQALRLGLVGRHAGEDDPALRTQAFGRAFRNPLGLAAGFDKDAVAVRALMALGFGFVEVGTVTPKPQAGNPRKRLFRLTQDRAVINRMGFNNGGLAAFLPRLAELSERPALLGANVGINKEGANPERDYPALVAAVGPLADYVVINVSSPNTPGLRDLQGEARLRAILAAIAAGAGVHPPLLVKIAPDVDPATLEALVEVCIDGGAAGLIISNTTIARPPELNCPPLRSPDAGEAGGLSGAPLFMRSTALLARAALLARGRLTLIGAGGVASGADALRKIEAGASLVQIYTSFIYGGPSLVPRLKAELARALKQAGFARVEDAVGTQAEKIACNL